MSRAHQHYPVASTSYQQPPSNAALHRIPAPVDRRHALAPSHPDLSQDIYIPESQEELNRVNIESRLLQPSGPSHKPNMRGADLTSASSTFDTYDRIGREDDFAATRPSAMPATSRSTRHHFDADESLIPGVGRGVRSTMPSQTSYQERIRSLNHHAAQNRYESSPSRSPYRPGKYSSGYVAAQARPPVVASSARPSIHQARSGAIPRQAQVESDSESDAESATDSGESDAAINVHTATFSSTGNHRNFAATPAGHTVTMTQALRQRPTLGQDTLDRIEFDLHTDTDGEHRPSRASVNARGRLSTSSLVRSHRPLCFPARHQYFGMKAAEYQQHLASRTLTSPALRTLIGDRSKSPDSPTPAPSIDGVLHAGKTNAKDAHRQNRHQHPRAARQSSVSAISAFEDLARRLQKDVELTQGIREARGEDMDDGSASNSGGSGFGPGSHASSARTRVEPEVAPNAGKAFNAAQFNSYGYPAHQKATTGNDATSPWGVRLPDVTGLTSALGSPVKARDAVKHRPFDEAVGNQEARLEELVTLRCFVDGIQVELDRAGERILNLEQAQEQQSHEFQGLRSEMQSALRDVRAKQPASDEQLVQHILEKLQVSNKPESQGKQGTQSGGEFAAAPRQRESEHPVRETRPSQQQQDARSHVEVVNRLYAELDKLRMTMEQQYRSTTGVCSTDADDVPDARPQHAAYRHQDNFPSGRNPWDAIEALRLQVLSLADEVEGLNGLVLDHLTQPTTVHRKRTARTSASRQCFDRDERYYDDAHPASDPVHTARGYSARSSHPAYHHERDGIRTDPIDHHISEASPRRVSFHRQRSSPPRPSTDDEYDRTLDAVAENLRTHHSRQRRRPDPSSTELDDYEISELADSRAALASARAGTLRPTHDTRHCTVCSATARSDRRKASRRARLVQAEQRREAVELEESILLETLESPTGSPASIGEEQMTTLRVILQEHWDEFLHQRMLYSELADELKTMSPSMGKTKRGILAQHVLEAVEALELKADRIERLQKVIDAGTQGKVRKDAGSRQATATIAGEGQGNRLKHAMESFERTSRDGAWRSRGGRNSPPTTIQL